MKAPYEGQVATVLGTLRGYRFWRFSENDMQLYPVHINLGPWTSGINMASCASDATQSRWPSSFDDGSSQYHKADQEEWPDWERWPAPQPGCTCGIYATYNHRQYRTHSPRFWMNYGPDFPSQIIHGSIKATGRVLLGERGFKAEKAEVEALWGWRAELAALAYDVPWLRTRRRFLKRFPPHDISNLLEE